jgi:hypothetical protein
VGSSFILEFGSLVAMLVSLGSVEQSGDKSPEESWQVHVQVPEESQQGANKHELKYELLVVDQDVDEADQEQDRDRKQHQAGQG